MSKATAAKPAASDIGGGIAFAATTATAPTSATAALGTGFTNVGYVSQDGVRRNISLESNVIKAWGGATAYATAGRKTETFRFKVIEAYGVDFQGMVMGNASGTLATGITVQSTDAPQAAHMWVVTMLEVDGVTHRIVIPEGVITAIGEIQYVDTDVTGYEVTITAIADSSGNTAYDYYQAASSGT